MILPQRAQGAAEKNLNAITGIVIDAAMKVHSALGPGLLESAYEACLKHEIVKKGVFCRESGFSPGFI